MTIQGFKIWSKTVMDTDPGMIWRLELYTSLFSICFLLVLLIFLSELYDETIYGPPREEDDL